MRGSYVAMVFLEYLFWLALGYVLLVSLIEVVVWRFQPPMEGSLTLVVNPDEESQIERRLDSFEYEGTLYVASNHWFRSWYKAVLANPNVEVVRNGSTRRYSADAVPSDEHEILSSNYKMVFVLRLLCGFAPSKFIRLTPNLQP